MADRLPESSRALRIALYEHAMDNPDPTMPKKVREAARKFLLSQMDPHRIASAMIQAGLGIETHLAALKRIIDNDEIGAATRLKALEMAQEFLIDACAALPGARNYIRRVEGAGVERPADADGFPDPFVNVPLRPRAKGEGA